MAPVASSRGPPLLLLAVVGSAVAAGVRLLLRRRPSLPRHPTVAHTHGSVLCALDLAPGPHPGPPAPPLPLAGLRFAVKDIFDVQGTVTGFGSPCWAATHGAAEQHAQAVAACLAAGARGTYKVVMDELAFSISGQNAHYGTPVNPCAPKHIPGGSSSGSAVACASGLVDFALGTDTGGSVRVPAAHCALFGMRPTHGAVSLEGAVPMSPSFDTVGWFARDAATLRAVGAALLPPGGLNGCQVPGAADAVRCFAVAEDCLRGVSDDAMAGVAALLQAAIMVVLLLPPRDSRSRKVRLAAASYGRRCTRCQTSTGPTLGGRQRRSAPAVPERHVLAVGLAEGVHAVAEAGQRPARLLQ